MCFQSIMVLKFEFEKYIKVESDDYLLYLKKENVAYFSWYLT